MDCWIMFFILSIKLPIAKKKICSSGGNCFHLPLTVFVSPFTTNFILFCTLWTPWAWRWLKLTDKRVQMKNKIKIYSSPVCIYSNCLFPQSDLSKRLRSFTCFSADETTVESKFAVLEDSCWSNTVQLHLYKIEVNRRTTRMRGG